MKRPNSASGPRVSTPKQNSFLSSTRMALPVPPGAQIEERITRREVERGRDPLRLLHRRVSVRHHTLGLAAEKGPGPSHTGLHLVHDQQCAALVAELGC